MELGRVNDEVIRVKQKLKETKFFPKKEELSTFPFKRVINGDTIEIKTSGRAMQIRLVRIDAPERHKRGNVKAKAALAKLIGSKKNLKLEFEKPAQDRLGRYLCYVFVERPKGRVHLNLAMVRLGHSKFYTEYGEGRYADEFRAAEKEAMNHAVKQGVLYDGADEADAE